MHEQADPETPSPSDLHTLKRPALSNNLIIETVFLEVFDPLFLTGFWLMQQSWT
jgi:hypothetical protein